MASRVFIVGWDAFNARFLGKVTNPERFDIRPCLDVETATRPPFDVPAMLDAASQVLDAEGPPDAVAGYWDFPTSALVALLRERYGLPGASLRATLACEHKWWSRQLQAEVLPELTPAFQALDPFAPDAARRLDLAFPVWVKPVKAHSSHLGFNVRDRDELEHALAAMRQGIGRFGRPFNDVLDRCAGLPDAARRIDGFHCLAEAIISKGRQCTLEGYVYGGEATIYGAVDSIRAGRHRSSFARYQYPSRLPRRVLSRMREAAGTAMPHLGYDHGPFNIEFFWDPDTDAVRLLEINPRISQSHAPLFYLVDGASHHQVMAELALGERPDPPHRAGRFPVAAKFMLRHFADATVQDIPDEAAIQRLHDRFPEAALHCHVARGQRLSALELQDSYSYLLADLYLGAEDGRALLTKKRDARRLLRFDLGNGDAPPARPARAR